LPSSVSNGGSSNPGSSCFSFTQKTWCAIKLLIAPAAAAKAALLCKSSTLETLIIAQAIGQETARWRRSARFDDPRTLRRFSAPLREKDFAEPLNI